MARITRNCAQCKAPFQFHSGSLLNPETCKGCRTRAVVRQCQGCGNVLGYRRHKWCDNCRDYREKRRDFQRSASRSAKKKKFADTVIKCEGCGCETRNGRKGTRDFCPGCAKIDDRYKKDRGRGFSFKFIRDYDFAAKKRRKPKSHTAHVLAWRRHCAKQSYPRGKPWLAPGLTPGEKWKIRYREDLAFAVSERLRLRCKRAARKDKNVAYTLRRMCAGKAGSPKVEDLIGCSKTEFIRHVERQFSKGMTWGRFHSGDIHIDHIRPLSSFDGRNEAQLREAWHFTNLRPLWASENMRKAASTDILL